MVKWNGSGVDSAVANFDVSLGQLTKTFIAVYTGKFLPRIKWPGLDKSANFHPAQKVKKHWLVPIIHA
jgi:hypothetical protein